MQQHDMGAIGHGDASEDHTHAPTAVFPAKAQPLAERGRGQRAKIHIFKNWVHPVLLSRACGEQTCSSMIPHTAATRPPECTCRQSRLLVSSLTEERPVLSEKRGRRAHPSTTNDHVDHPIVF